MRRMLIFAAGFVSGNIALHGLSDLPGWESAVLAPLLLLLCRRGRVACFIGAFAGGFLCTLAAAVAHKADVLPAELEGRNINAVIRVASIPVNRGYTLRFDAEVMDAAAEERTLPRRLRLSLYRSRKSSSDAGVLPSLRPGDVLDATLRLKRPHGYMNPGGFDYERYLFSQRIGARGYVRDFRLRERAGRWSPPVLRHRLYERLKSQGAPHIGAVIALALGERGLMEPANRDLLFATGTGHLFAISGLHIALVFGFVFLISKVLWSRLLLRLTLWPSAHAATIPAFFAACLYAWLAGFTIPTQRALIMLGCVVAGVLLGRRVSIANTLPLALVAVVLYDPMSTLTASFWLSFTAIGFIAFYLGLHPWPKKRAWLHLQTALPLALVPAGLWFFGYGALAAPLANLVAVPLVSLLVLPSVLLATASAPFDAGVCAFFVACADFLLGAMWHAGAWLASLDFLQWFHRPPLWSYPSAIAGAIAMTLVSGWRRRTVAAVLLLPLTVAADRGLPAGAFEAAFLDVGQGLSVVITTREHALLFDTGPVYRSGFSTAKAVVIPYLHWRGIKRLDALIVSHGDNDHAGGVGAVDERFAIERRLGGGDMAAVAGFEHCRDGEAWSWDDVRFEIVHPGDGDAFSGNNASCVLKISAGEHSLLLTGDIEKRAENALLARARERLAASVMLVPHHGSLTSSATAFVSAVAPDIAVVTSGYLNRFGLPKAQVMRRYHKVCARVLNTADSGTVSMRFVPGRGIEPRSYRREARRYWHVDSTPPVPTQTCR